MNIGDKIKFLRNKHKLTQKQLAQALASSTSTVGMYEQNRREPDNATIVKIAQFFCVSTDYLLNLTDNPSSEIISPFISEHEKMLLQAYRAKPEYQLAVDIILEIDENSKINVYKAANSEDKHSDTIEPMDPQQWNEMESTPTTDDDLQ